jgi:hypothetical protein
MTPIRKPLVIKESFVNRIGGLESESMREYARNLAALQTFEPDFRSPVSRGLKADCL